MPSLDTTFVAKDARNRVLMESSVIEDVKRWIENNFPHHHNEPGSAVQGYAPDVVLVEPDGTQHAYLDHTWQEDTNFKRESGRFVPDDTPVAKPAATPTKSTK